VPNVSGATPFGGICGLGHAGLLRLALANGADLEARSNFSNKSDMTPLMLAASGGHLEAVELLLEAGADPSARTESSATARTLAQEAGHQDIAALLDEHSGPP
jgi:ankyrin repeat protein